MVHRILVGRRTGFTQEAEHLCTTWREQLSIPGLRRVTLLRRYDVEGLSPELLDRCRFTVFSEPQTDTVFDALPNSDHAFAVEYLPGQYDQRADSCAQCIQIVSGEQRPLVRTATVYLLDGDLSKEALLRIQQDVVNPVEARLASFAVPDSLELQTAPPEPIPVLTGFLAQDMAALTALKHTYGLAMDLDDLRFCQSYFREEQRDPTLTELRVLDTYWSDHCRHTTFLTELVELELLDPRVQESFARFQALRAEVQRADKPITLMELATIAVRYLKQTGKLPLLDESEEINACTVKTTIQVDQKPEEWLFLFKNETHNHPTEIEPFGGAATCIGGAIRDPLSGRGYVYQAMRVTGAGDPTSPLTETLPGKLPQHKIVVTAAEGYSSYGNQIGLATGLVEELYHPGYVAKRLEIGAVVAAVPARQVRRERPTPGDKVILLGGRTGRDGCGGATGSSKSHTADSLSLCGAEVQKGNAPEERKLQRLFRNPLVTQKIKRCNDFGAGGVAVAVGELCDGLSIQLDAVPKKYAGLSGTELAISESQERMAVVVEAQDVEEFLALAQYENLEATVVATVQETPRLQMTWNGTQIVDLSRAFLDSNGAKKTATVQVPVPNPKPQTRNTQSVSDRMTALVRSLPVCSRRGLSERFDSTIGAGTVFMPFGGTTQRTPIQGMAAKLPVLHGESDACSVTTYGFDPDHMERDPYGGAYASVVESLAKLTAMGCPLDECYLSFQEYFERMQHPTSWGKPVAALLGAMQAQLDFEIAAIGGKDSMSGTFAPNLSSPIPAPNLQSQNISSQNISSQTISSQNISSQNISSQNISSQNSSSPNIHTPESQESPAPEPIHVPPTLVSFAAALTETKQLHSNEFKAAGHTLVYAAPPVQANGLPDPARTRKLFAQIRAGLAAGQIYAAQAVLRGGIAEALFLMSLGDRIGATLVPELPSDLLFLPEVGAFVLETDETLELGCVIGHTCAAYELTISGETLSLSDLETQFEQPLEGVFATKTPQNVPQNELFWDMKSLYWGRAPHIQITKYAKPRVLIPVFPGTNCEYDTARAFEHAGAIPEFLVVNNQSSEQLNHSIQRTAQALSQTQILFLPGGFSGGDEPDGSGKFITAFFRNPALTDAVHELLHTRQGLVGGICNGFQALIKLGLLPFGDIRDMTPDCPTLTYNLIRRHQSKLVRTRVTSVLSPWLAETQPGEVHLVPISHGEGRFLCPEPLLKNLFAAGQIATQYVDFEGAPTMDIQHNPNGSLAAVEGLTSPDGRVFGKMGHSERTGSGLYKNVPGNTDNHMFASAVQFFF